MRLRWRGIVTYGSQFLLNWAIFHSNYFAKSFSPCPLCHMAVLNSKCQRLKLSCVQKMCIINRPKPRICDYTVMVVTATENSTFTFQRYINLRMIKRFVWLCSIGSYLFMTSDLTCINYRGAPRLLLWSIWLNTYYKCECDWYQWNMTWWEVYWDDSILTWIHLKVHPIIIMLFYCLAVS